VPCTNVTDDTDALAFIVGGFNAAASDQKFTSIVAFGDPSPVVKS
jgi:hypothetical protein